MMQPKIVKDSPWRVTGDAKIGWTICDNNGTVSPYSHLARLNRIVAAHNALMDRVPEALKELEEAVEDCKVQDEGRFYVADIEKVRRMHEALAAFRGGAR